MQTLNFNLVSEERIRGRISRTNPNISHTLYETGEQHPQNLHLTAKAVDFWKIIFQKLKKILQGPDQQIPSCEHNNGQVDDHRRC